MRKTFYFVFSIPYIFLAAAGATSIATPRAPVRIVSTFTGSDEILWGLLPENERARVLAFSALATQDAYCNIANEVRALGLPTFAAELETVAARKPDLIIMANYNRPELRQAYARLSIPTLTLSDFRTLADIHSNIVAIGKAIHREQLAVEMLRSLDSKLSRLPKLRRPWRVIGFDPDRIVMGKDTLFDAMVTTIGASNVASELGIKGWQQVSEEALMKSNPDVIIVGTAHDQPMTSALALVRQNPGWQYLEATRAGRVVSISSARLSAVSHFFADAAEDVANALNALSPPEKAGKP